MMMNTSDETFLLLVSVAVITPCSLGGGKTLFFTYVHYSHKDTHHSGKEQIAVFYLLMMLHESMENAPEAYKKFSTKHGILHVTKRNTCTMPNTTKIMIGLIFLSFN